MSDLVELRKSIVATEEFRSRKAEQLPMLPGMLKLGEQVRREMSYIILAVLKRCA